MQCLADDQLSPKQEEAAELGACAHSIAGGFLKIRAHRDQRFQGKVTEPTARCRGGMKAVQFRFTPWVDWSNYWGAGDTSSLPVGFLSVSGPKLRGVAERCSTWNTSASNSSSSICSTTPELTRPTSRAAAASPVRR